MDAVEEPDRDAADRRWRAGHNAPLPECPHLDIGPDSWKALMQYLSDHPDLLRAIGVAEVAVGMALIASDGTARERMEEEAAAMRARIRSIA